MPLPALRPCVGAAPGEVPICLRQVQEPVLVGAEEGMIADIHRRGYYGLIDALRKTPEVADESETRARLTLDLKALVAQGWTAAALARELGLPQRTIGRYLNDQSIPASKIVFLISGRAQELLRAD